MNNSVEDNTNENASELKFGDFVFNNDVIPLDNDTAFLTLSQLNDSVSDPSYIYLKRVATTSVMESLTIISNELRGTFAEVKFTDNEGKQVLLHPYEVISLCNFVKDIDRSDENDEISNVGMEFDEVKTLIPSLGRFQDSEIARAVKFIEDVKARKKRGTPSGSLSRG